MRSKIIGVAGAVLLFALGSPALAAGCNGVVSPAEWGCAPWDNNNGPQFKHWRGASTAPPAAAVSQQQKPIVQPNGGSGFISHNGGGIVAQGGGN